MVIGVVSLQYLTIIQIQHALEYTSNCDCAKSE